MVFCWRARLSGAREMRHAGLAHVEARRCGGAARGGIHGMTSSELRQTRSSQVLRTVYDPEMPVNIYELA